MKNTVIKYNKKVLLNSFIVFFAVFIPKVLLCLAAHPLSVPSDEIATMSAGAYLAGLDWSEVISHAGYYGSGMTIFTAPIYWMTDNPVVIYRAVGIFCAFLQSVPAVIAYYTVRKYYELKEAAAMLIGMVSGFFVMAQAHVIYNENALILVSWIIMLLIYKLHESIDHKKRKRVYSFLLMVLLSYSMTLHTRAVTFWIVLAVLVICYRWSYGKWLISLPITVISGIAGWVVSHQAIHYVQSLLWKLEAGESVRNGSINVGGGFRALFHLEDIRAWLSIILGQIHTIGVFTGGFAVLLVCAFIAVVCQFLFSKKCRKKLASDAIINISIPVIIFFLSAVMITIAGQSISWLGGSIAVYEGGFESQEYGVKAYGYLRYFGVYCGPLLMIGMVWLIRKKELLLRFFKWTLLLLILIEIYWIVCIVPYIHLCREWGVFDYYYPFTWHSLQEPARYLAFMPASAAMFAVFILERILVKRDKREYCIAVLLVLFLNTYYYHSLKWDALNADICITWADDGYRAAKAVEKSGKLPKVIYVEDLWDKTDHNNFYVYQFLLNRYQIIPERPEKGIDEAVLFSNRGIEDGVYDQLLDEGYKYSYLGDYEIVLVKGEMLQDAFEEAGIQLLSHE